MSVFKRGKHGRKVKNNEPGTWNYSFMYKGRRYRQALPGVETKSKASEIERKKKVALVEGNADETREILFEQFVLTVYLPHKKTVNKDTCYMFENMAKVFRAHFKGKMLHEITSADVQAFRQKRAEGITNKGRERALATLNRERNQLSGIFSLAVDNGYIAVNPVKKVKPYKLDNTRVTVLEEEEEERLFAALTGTREKFKPVILLALHTGMRLREVTELKWEQVNLSEIEDEREIILMKTRTSAKTKNKKWRAIPLNDVAFNLLKDLHDKGDGKGRVFSEKGLSAESVCHRFSKICDDIGLPHVTMHVLRHTFASRLARQGDVNLEQLRELMGHSDLRMTQRYSHLNRKSLRETVKKLEKV
jgi:integrase